MSSTRLWAAVGIGGVAAMVVRAGWRGWAERLLSGRRGRVGVMIGVIAFVVLLARAWGTGRSFIPYVTDEQCYLIQAKMILSGRMWMPAHPAGESIASFHLLTNPAYAVKYPPGTALVFAAGMLCRIPPWGVTIVFAAISVGLFYRVTAELLGDGWGVAGAMLLLCSPAVLGGATMQMSQPVMMLLCLGLVYACWRWFCSPTMWRAALAGGVAGFALITRPMDAVCVLVALAVCAVAGMVGDARLRRRVLTHGICAAAVVMPCTLIQLACNKGITGSWLTTPWEAYAARNNPYDGVSSKPVDEGAISKELVPQKWLIIETDAERYAWKLQTPFFTRLVERRLNFFLEDTLVSPWLCVVIPIGIVALRGAWLKWALWLQLPAVAAGYTFYTLYGSYYAMVTAPCAAFMSVAGAVGCGVAWRGWGWRAGVFVVAWAVAYALPAVFQIEHEEPAQRLMKIDRILNEIPGRALVLFEPNLENPVPEPVYNTESAWPDDARVVRLHARSPEANWAVYRYYADANPDRMVYLYREGRLKVLGPVRELASHKP